MKKKKKRWNTSVFMENTDEQGSLEQSPPENLLNPMTLTLPYPNLYPNPYQDAHNLPFQNPNPVQSWDSNVQNDVIHPPAVEPSNATHISSGCGIPVPVPSYTYQSTQAIASTSTPFHHYPHDPNAQLILASFGTGITEPANVTSKLVPTSITSSLLSNQKVGPQSSVIRKKGPKKIKAVQSGWCEFCKVHCNSKSVLDQHQLGRKHKKNLLKKLIAENACALTQFWAATPAPAPAPVSTDIPAPASASASASTDIPAPVSTDIPAPASASASTDIPAPVSTDILAPASTDIPAPAPASTDILAPAPVSADIPAPAPAPASTDISAPASTDIPAPAPASTDIPAHTCVLTQFSAATPAPAPALTDIPANASELTQCSAATPAQATASVDIPAPITLALPPTASTALIIGPNGNPDVSKPELGKKARKKAAAKEDLETKKRKLLEGGVAASDVRMCTICNVVCNSEMVFMDHLAGQKHATMMKKSASTTGTASNL